MKWIWLNYTNILRSKNSHLFFPLPSNSGNCLILPTNRRQLKADFPVSDFMIITAPFAPFLIACQSINASLHLTWWRHQSMCQAPGSWHWVPHLEIAWWLQQYHLGNLQHLERTSAGLAPRRIPWCTEVVPSPPLLPLLQTKIVRSTFKCEKRKKEENKMDESKTQSTKELICIPTHKFFFSLK